jgi:hypothetical protein
VLASSDFRLKKVEHRLLRQGRARLDRQAGERSGAANEIYLRAAASRQIMARLSATPPPPCSSPAPQIAFAIIGGAWRGRSSAFPRGAVRPTPTAFRETLFNWLGQDCRPACLDLYAGTGALSLEAARAAPASRCRRPERGW